MRTGTYLRYYLEILNDIEYYDPVARLLNHPNSTIEWLR